MKYKIILLMGLALLGSVSCGELLSNLVVVPLGGVRVFLNLDESFFITQSDAGEVGEEGDQYGKTLVAAGDLNGDGFEDVMVGAPGKDGGAGAVFGLFGSEAGATAGAGFAVTQADAGEGE